MPDGNLQKEMTLSHAEFLSCFKLHILPKRFVKIRHYGLLQNHGKIKRLNKVRKQLKLSPSPPKVQVPIMLRMPEKYGNDKTLCPKCSHGKLILIHINYDDRERPVSKNLALVTGDKTTTLVPP